MNALTEGTKIAAALMAAEVSRREQARGARTGSGSNVIPVEVVESVFGYYLQFCKMIEEEDAKRSG